MSEAPSRPSTDYGPAIYGPVPLFDTQLKFLSDSYMNMFVERKRIEETYVESLVKLYRKIKSLDSFLDDRSDLNSTRSAWSEVRDNVEREVHARQAFIATLSTDVIQPLTNFKETQERTRKRIKEDLKESGIAYQEYAEVTLPKLKSRYQRKFQEVEDSKKAAAAPTLSPTAGFSPDYQGLKPTSQPSSSRPTVTSPQPLRALDRRPSGGAGGRNRSPSSSATAFSDFAKEGKKQLNSLIGFLEKSGSVNAGSGGKENHALRTVRAKRELDEADKEYRKGVHWLETLRLRRVRTLESGYNSVVLFVEEGADTIKKILEKYTDNLTATYATQTQLYSHARTVVSKISPEKDKAKMASIIPKPTLDPVLYQNCIVGECHDLIFGFSLLDYATTKNLPEGEVPKIIQICIAEIDTRGLEAEGIYRVSGRHAIVQAMQHELERDERAFSFTPKDDIFAVASLLKLYLRELPEPVFRFSLQERVQHSEDLADHVSNNFVLLRSKMRRLPPVHLATLKSLLEHLSRVASHSDKNKMDPKNLAIVFGGVIFGVEDEVPKDGLLAVQNFKDSLMEDLITNAGVLFRDDGHGQPQGTNASTADTAATSTTVPSPTATTTTTVDTDDGHHAPSPDHPLPPMPSDQEPAELYYGSKTTRIQVAPPPPVISPAVSPQDFAPPLPPRPTNSIHPSARSPTKMDFGVGPPLPMRPSRQGGGEHPPPSPRSSILESTSEEGGELDSGGEESIRGRRTER
ncbi:RhoGAP-domain-containing protein [Marasmius fiardii PR-910]|nr:RhoGAP-domain-containing protein [Marasmius fiardii PR-910]